VRDYFARQKFKSDPALFFDYYGARHWNGINDWFAAARAWEKRQGKFDAERQAKARASPSESALDRIIAEEEAKLYGIAEDLEVVDEQIGCG
jgi:hypothetical protein